MTALPWARWARHLVGGTLRVSGRLPDDPASWVVEGVYTGGVSPRLAEARSVGPAGPSPLTPAETATLLDALHDVEVEAVGAANADLRVELAHGVRLLVAEGTVVTVSACVEGPPGHWVLARPVIVGFGGEGVAVDHDGLLGVARWVNLRLSRFTLAPDGEVKLAGRAARGLDLAAQGGLQLASAQVTRLVRGGRRFRSLHPYLRLSGSGIGADGGDGR